jgi:hypothetical protein
VLKEYIRPEQLRIHNDQSIFPAKHPHHMSADQNKTESSEEQANLKPEIKPRIKETEGMQ